MDKSILNKTAENNTSSAFLLPSEFKEMWKEMSESIVDVFSDFLDDFTKLISVVETCF